MRSGVRSMTGFGRGVSEQARTRATVDIRAVNHRFLDLKLRGALAPALEDAISSRVRGAIERGAVTVSVHVVRDGGGGAMQDCRPLLAERGRRLQRCTPLRA